MESGARRKQGRDHSRDLSRTEAVRSELVQWYCTWSAMPIRRLVLSGRMDMATSGSGASHRVRIAMLGGFRVAVDGGPCPDGSWGRDRATRLLKVLSLKEGHTASREELIRDLRILADREQDELLRRTAAQANAKLGLRRAAQEEDDPHLWIVAPRQGQRAFRANELWTDVAAFEGLYAIPAAARTLAHYREAIGLRGRFAAG
ncbi:MAG: hypothetical protein U0841_31030 [Chloroflexia bacterium]